MHNNKKVSNRALAESALPGQKVLSFLLVGAHVYWDLVKSDWTYTPQVTLLPWSQLTTTWQQSIIFGLPFMKREKKGYSTADVLIRHLLPRRFLCKGTQNTPEWLVRDGHVRTQHSRGNALCKCPGTVAWYQMINQFKNTGGQWIFTWVFSSSAQFTTNKNTMIAEHNVLSFDDLVLRVCKDIFLGCYICPWRYFLAF